MEKSKIKKKNKKSINQYIVEKIKRKERNKLSRSARVLHTQHRNCSSRRGCPSVTRTSIWNVVVCVCVMIYGRVSVRSSSPCTTDRSIPFIGRTCNNNNARRVCGAKREPTALPSDRLVARNRFCSFNTERGRETKSLWTSESTRGMALTPSS